MHDVLVKKNRPAGPWRHKDACSAVRRGAAAHAQPPPACCSAEGAATGSMRHAARLPCVLPSDSGLWVQPRMLCACQLASPAAAPPGRIDAAPVSVCPSRKSVSAPHSRRHSSFR